MAVGTTYFAGNDFTSYTAVGNVAVSTSTSTFRATAGWVSSSMSVNSGGTNEPPGDRIETPVFTANSLMWVHARPTNDASGLGNTNNAVMLELLDAMPVTRLVVRGTGTSGQLKVEKRNGSGTYTTLFTTAAGALPSGSLVQNVIDLFVDYSITGAVSLLINDVVVGGVSNTDVTTDGATQLCQAYFSSPSNAGHPLYWSEALVSDSITVNAGVFRLSPQAAGVTQNWKGVPSTVVGTINKTSVNDTSFMATGGSADLSGWTTPTAFPSGAWLVQSIVQEARVAVGLSGPQHFDWYVRTADGSDHNPGVSNAPTTTFSNFPNYIWPANPHTTFAWDTSDIASGFNLGVLSAA